MSSGRDESRSVKRRQARLRRRMLERRGRRLNKLGSLLQQELPKLAQARPT